MGCKATVRGASPLSTDDANRENNCVHIAGSGARDSLELLISLTLIGTIEMRLPVLFVLGSNSGILDHQQILSVIFLGGFGEVERAG